MIREYEDEDFSTELDSFEYDDCPYHAPSAFVEASRCEREERKRREREDLLDLWREEVRERRREQMAGLRGVQDAHKGRKWIHRRKAC